MDQPNASPIQKGRRLRQQSSPFSRSAYPQCVYKPPVLMPPFQITPFLLPLSLPTMKCAANPLPTHASSSKSPPFFFRSAYPSPSINASSSFHATPHIPPTWSRLVGSFTIRTARSQFFLCCVVGFAFSRTHSPALEEREMYQLKVQWANQSGRRCIGRDDVVVGRVAHANAGWTVTFD